MQGTSLPKEVAEQLDDMFAHKSLASAADTIKRQYRRLRKRQVELDHSSQHSSHEAMQQMDDILHRQGSAAPASYFCSVHVLVNNFVNLVFGQGFALADDTMCSTRCLIGRS